ncbi:CG11374, partial [Drosophila busckii]
MNIYQGARSVVLRRELDPMSTFYEERSLTRMRHHFELQEPPMPGLSFFIHGVIQLDCENFSIDFFSTKHCDQQRSHDIPLRIGARLPQNFMIRNTRIMDKWGLQENSSNLPFQLKHGDPFWMQVLLTEESFYISVNGYHFAQYVYRMPIKWIVGVDIRGGVFDMVVDKFYVTEYPIRISHSAAGLVPLTEGKPRAMGAHTMPNDWLRIEVPSIYLRQHEEIVSKINMPFYGYLSSDRKLIDGRALRIEGRVRLMPQEFRVALQCGQNIWPQPTVSFMFNPTFLRTSKAKMGKAVIVRSAYINDEWVNSEVSRLHTHLGPGKAFVILVACRKTHYEVYVDGKLLVNFRHRMNPEDVDMLFIYGDVKLWHVSVE